MQDKQVGEASVLSERQAERRFGLAARLSVAVHTIGVAINSINVTINTIHMAVDTIHTIRDVVSWKDKFALDGVYTLQISACAYIFSQGECLLCDSTFLLLLFLLLQFILLLQVDVRRLHSDDGFVQKTEGFLHVFGLHLVS